MFPLTLNGNQLHDNNQNTDSSYLQGEQTVQVQRNSVRVTLHLTVCVNASDPAHKRNVQAGPGSSLLKK